MIVAHDWIHFMGGIMTEIDLWFLVNTLFFPDLLPEIWQQMIKFCQSTTINR